MADNLNRHVAHEAEEQRAREEAARRTADQLLDRVRVKPARALASKSSDGRVFVPVCTSEEYVPANWPGWRRVTGATLGPLLEGYPLLVNPIGPISAIVPAADLVS